MSLDIVVFGLSITSSWGNGHASTYRALIKALARRGHRVSFAERDMPWYRSHRDLHEPGYCRVVLYRSLPEAARRFGSLIADADLVILGSYVPDGNVLGDWITSRAQGVTAFYDIDTPVTLTKLAAGGAEYISARLIPRFDLFLSFTGGPVPQQIERQYGSPRARVLYCAADPEVLSRPASSPEWALGYLGTYSMDRQPALSHLLIEPARAMQGQRFAVAGAQYPVHCCWPPNVQHVEHIAPDAHAAFYASQRFTLNVTRAAMVSKGYSPSVRLFEAAACGTPIISDRWPGLDTIFTPGREILIAEQAGDVVKILSTLPEDRRLAIAAAARRRLLACHTAEHRAKDLEQFYAEAREDARAAAEDVVA